MSDGVWSRKCRRRGYVRILLLIFAAFLKPKSMPLCAVTVHLVLCVKGWWFSSLQSGGGYPKHIVENLRGSAEIKDAVKSLCTVFLNYS
jgi:hypothetical protein